MKISIIIPTFNAENNIETLLAGIALQNITDFEVIVIDSSSTDKTLQIAQTYGAKTISVPRNKFDHGGTRTNALQEAKGDMAVLFSQDVKLYDSDSIKNLINVFDNQDIALAYGRQVPALNATVFAKHLRIYNYPPESYVRSLKDRKKYKIKCAMFSNSFSAYRISKFQEIGFFKNGINWGEDLWACSKMLLAGNKVAYVANAKVYHSHNFSLWEEFQRYFDAGVMLNKEKWILAEYGEASDEGIRYVKSCLLYLIKNNNKKCVLEFFARMAMKFLGYNIGKNEKILPTFVKLKFTMNHAYWKINKNEI